MSGRWARRGRRLVCTPVAGRFRFVATRFAQPLTGARSRLVSGLAFLLAAVPFRVAAAPTPRAQVIYVREQGAEQCPDEEQLRAAVAARLGYNPFSPLAQRTVTAVVRPADHGLVASIELADALGEVAGTRQLRSRRSDCVELASALELAIALAIDPLSLVPLDGPASAVPPRSAGPDPAGAAADSGAATPPEDSSSSQTRRKSPPPPPAIKTRIFGGAGALLALGSAPSVAAAGFKLALGFRELAWSVVVELRGDVPGGARQIGGWVSTALATVSLVACLHVRLAELRTGRVEAAGCGLAGGGVQFIHADGYEPSFQSLNPYFAGGVRLAFEVPLGHRLAFQAHADVSFPATLTVINVQQANGIEQRVYVAPPVSGVVGAALLVYFR